MSTLTVGASLVLRVQRLSWDIEEQAQAMSKVDIDWVPRQVVQRVLDVLHDLDNREDQTRQVANYHHRKAKQTV